MFKKLSFALLWLAFLTYAIGLAPPDRPDTVDLILNLSTGQWTDINPLVVALFNLMGIWPAIYSAVLFADGRGQKIGAWPFAIASFGVGAFAILPYLVRRDPNPTFVGEKTGFIRFWDSRITGVVLLLATAAILVYGLRGADWGDFVAQWQSSRFLHVMGLDFCLLSLLFPALLSDDLSRRGTNNPIAFWVVALIPLFGPLVYLCVRSPIPE